MGIFWHEEVPENQLERIIDIHKDIGGRCMEVAKQEDGTYTVTSSLPNQVDVDAPLKIIPAYLNNQK